MPHVSTFSQHSKCLIEKVNKVEKEKWFEEFSKQGSMAKKRIASFIDNAPEYFRCHKN